MIQRLSRRRGGEDPTGAVAVHDGSTLDSERPHWTFLTFGILGAALLAFLRTPRMLVHGRVYAEEGEAYFYHAWNTSFWSALVASHQGYLSIYPNLVTDTAAHFLPLPMLSLALVWSSLAVQLWVGFHILTCERLRTGPQRVLALAVFLLAPPNVETWLNTINCQFLFAAGVAIVLVSSADERLVGRTSFLAMAALDGVTGCAPLPLFWLRYLLSRSRGGLIQASVLTVAAAAQAAYVLQAGRPIAVHHFRLMGATFLENLLLLPFASRLADVLFSRFILAHLAAPWLVASAIVSLLFVAWLAALVWPSVGARWLLAAALISQLLGWWGALDTGVSFLNAGSGGRYFLTGSILMGLALVLLVADKRAVASASSRWRKWAAGAMIGCFCLSGAADFLRYRRPLDTFPDWQAQVAAWRKDGTRKFHAYPEGFLPFALSPRHVPDPSDLRRDAP